jgi:hypothetical protein
MRNQQRRASYLLRVPESISPEFGDHRTRKSGSVALMLGGLILMQLVTLVVVAFLVWHPAEQEYPPDLMAAYHVPAGRPPQAPIVPLFPTPTRAVPKETPTPVVVRQQPTAVPQNILLRLRGVELTQGVQVFNEPELERCVPDPSHSDYIFCNNSLPMVAGRHTLIRVYPACNGLCSTGMTAIQIRLFKKGQELAAFTQLVASSELQRISALSMSEMRSDLENSVNFELIPAPDWLAGDVTIQVEVFAPAETEAPPVRTSSTRNFAVRKPLRIAYLPISVDQVKPDDPSYTAYWLERIFPVPAVEYERLPVPNLTLKGELGKGELLRQLLYNYWFYAQSQPPNNRPDQLFGWLPQEIYNGGASDPFWCPNCAGPHSSRVAFGGLRPEQDIGGPRILVHEIAHNLGAKHAWSPTYNEDSACFKAEGADIRVDPHWPYAETPHIQEFGVDLYSDPPVIYPPSYYDLMAYCARPWISPYTYRELFYSPFLQTGPETEPLFTNYQPQTETTEKGTLLVSGIIYPNGSVAQPEVLKLASDAFGPAAAFYPPVDLSPPTGSDYCLEVLADNGSQLAQRCFDAGFEDLETGLPTEPAPYFFTLTEVDPAAVDQIVISHNKTEQVRVSASQAPPQLNLTYPRGGEVLEAEETITWDAYDADGDRLQFDLFYSIDNGAHWLPLALRLKEPRYTLFAHQLPVVEDIRFRVVANDGFHTTAAEVSGAVAVRPLPANSIHLAGPATISPGQSFKVQVVAQDVTEPGLYGIRFQLSFDPELIEVDSVQANPAFELVLDDTIEHDRGSVSFLATRLGRVEDLTGQLVVATLNVTARSTSGRLYLTLHNVEAAASEGVYLALTDMESLSLTVTE